MQAPYPVESTIRGTFHDLLGRNTCVHKEQQGRPAHVNAQALADLNHVLRFMFIFTAFKYCCP